MIKISETEPKISARKKNIAVKDVFISDGILTDDDGMDVLATIQNELPEDVKYFSFKISVEVPDVIDIDELAPDEE